MTESIETRSFVQNYRVITHWGARLLIVLGAVVIAGWIFEIERLKTILPGYSSMKANTASGFICAGLALLLAMRGGNSRSRRNAAALLSVMVFAIGLLTLAEYVWHVDLGIDQILFRDYVQLPYPGRLAPISAIHFVAVGLALLLVSLSGKWMRWAQSLALLTGLSSLLAIIGYFYGVPVLYGSFAYTSMALHTGMGFLVLSIAVLCCRPDTGWMAVITSDGAGAWLSRRLIPAAVALPIMVGGLFLKTGGVLTDVRLVIACIVIGQVVLFGGLIWFLAWRMNRADMLLKEAEKEKEKTRKALARSEEMLRQAQKLEAVGQLAGGIAHDFNNLLTVILGFSELLTQSEELSLKDRNRVEKIQHAGQSGASLVRQLLAFSRQQLIQPTVLDMSEVIGHMNELLRRLVREDVRLIVRSETQAGPVRADAGQIEQVVMNLVVNASDSMPEGGTLIVETGPEMVEDERAAAFQVKAGAFVRLSVADTGQGMTAEVRARIFEPFFTTKGVGKGTGLGLATVYGIVQQNGGFIEVESTEGAGSLFRVYLPVVTEQPKRDLGPQLIGSSSRGATVLLAEDGAELRALMVETLQHSGYKVLVATDGKEALEICREYKGGIHLLLTDVVMPNMSGRELVEKLRQARRGLKIVFMSGYTNDVVMQQGVFQQEVEFLQKPFTGTELIQKIEEVLTASTQEAGLSGLGLTRA